jgi:hypothetical protein
MPRERRFKSGLKISGQAPAAAAHPLRLWLCCAAGDFGRRPAWKRCRRLFRRPAYCLFRPAVGATVDPSFRFVFAGRFEIGQAHGAGTCGTGRQEKRIDAKPARR